jgi:hypothetical protein
MLLTSKVITLCLNKSWIPIGTRSVAEAVSDLFSKNYLAVNIEEDDGAPIFSTYTLEEWMKIPITENDLYISSIKIKLKVPVAIITKNFNKVPLLETKLNYDRIVERDNYTCQYSGRKFSKEEARINGSIDHIIPKSRGGKDSWENLVFCDKDINLAKSNKTPEEAGLKLIKKPSSVAYKLPFQLMLKNINHKSWKHFIINKNE